MTNVSDVPHDTSQTPVSDRVDLSTWLTKQQAAAAIGVSTKAIERFTQAGKLEQRLRPQAHGPKVAVYFPDDVQKLAQERRPAAPPFVLAAGSDVTGNGNGARGDVSLRVHTAPPLSALSPLSPDDPLRAFAAAVYAAVMSQTSQTSPSPASETVYVTVKEAAAILGLPQADVRRICQDGDLNYRLTGRGGIRIRRKDLEQL